MKYIYLAIFLFVFGVTSNVSAKTTPLPGLYVTIVDSVGRTVGKGFTDSTGKFTFKHVEVGVYTIVAVQRPHEEKPSMNRSGTDAGMKMTMTISGKGVKSSPVKIKGTLSDSHHSVNGSISVKTDCAVTCTCSTAGVN